MAAALSQSPGVPCQTEWQERFPLAPVCQWIGNSLDMAARHYLTARDAHFEAAISSSGHSATVAPTGHGGAKNGAVPARTEPPTPEADTVEPAYSGRGAAARTDADMKVGAGGFEPP